MEIIWGWVQLGKDVTLFRLKKGRFINNFNIMKNSLKNMQFANEKNIKPINPRSKAISDISLQSYPQNSPYLQSPSKPPSLPQPNRQRLIQQNQKLKKHVLQLAQQMDQIISKQKQKKKYGLGLDDNVDKQTQMKKLQIKKQQIKILTLKEDIFNLKKENEYVYDDSSVIDKQNSVKLLENQLKILEAERTALMNVRKEQSKALNSYKNDLYEEKMQKTKSQLQKIKQQCKALTLKTSQNQKSLMKIHQKVVGKSKKIKDIQQKIKQNKQKLRKGNTNIVTIDMISQIQSQIIKLQSQYKQSQKAWIQKIGNLDIEISNRRIEQEKKLIILKDKEKEVKLTDIRIKQFKKLIIQSKSMKKVQNESSVKEFRNKRNIKYLQRQNS